MPADLPDTWWNLAAMILVQRGLVWTSAYGYCHGPHWSTPSVRPPLCASTSAAIRRMGRRGYIADPRSYPRNLQLTQAGRQSLATYLASTGLADALTHSMRRDAA